MTALFTVLAFARGAAAYRTGEDSTSLGARGRVSWREPSITFRLSRAHLPANVSEGEAEAAAQRALQAWQGQACSALELNLAAWSDGAAAAQDATNSIAWVADWAERGLPSSAPGYTDLFYRGTEESWRIAEADILLNPEASGLSLEAVLTHEMGHALGLLHPCEEDGRDGAPLCDGAPDVALESTMYPFYGEEQATPGEDDVAGLCYLYPADPSGPTCDDACGPRQACVDGACRDTCGNQICNAQQECGAWGCVSKNGCLLDDCTGQPCEITADCGPLLTCEGKVCLGGAAPWGEKCETSLDCGRGACIDEVCKPLCHPAAESSTSSGCSGTCQESEVTQVGGCLDSRQHPLGSVCAVGEDCESAVCAVNPFGAACTLTCESSSDCPKDWSCDSVDGRRACLPPHLQPRDGCTISRGALRSRAPSSSFATAIALLVAAATLSRKLAERSKS